jgi:hypothetical protein
MFARLTRRRTPPAALMLPALLAGCASDGPARSGDAAAALRPAAHINHVVFLDLRDPDDAQELIDDSRRWLGAIPGVRSIFVGRHFDVGRDAVRSDYDVGLYIGLQSPEAYEVYLDHPNHRALLEKWGDRLARYWVYDVEDAEATLGTGRR